jgi:hypothetical protein
MAAQQPQENGQPLINEHMAAHLHGAVRTSVRPCRSSAADRQPNSCSDHSRPGPDGLCRGVMHPCAGIVLTESSDCVLCCRCWCWLSCCTL